jgi:hypothetical protein
VSDRTVTGAIRKALAAKYCAPEWATFYEVAERTGGGCRSADAIAMNLYASRGLRVHGFEIKASRSDWQRELKDPTKADPIMRHCDHWWIAARPGIVLDGELPPTWGLLELTGNGLRQKVAAPKLDAQPMERPFIAALLRRAADRAARELHEAAEAKIVKEREAIEERIRREVERRTQQHSDLATAVAEFEEASGLKIQRYGDMKGMGEAVKMLQEMGITRAWGGVRGIALSARKFADQVDALLPARTKDEDGIS